MSEKKISYLNRTFEDYQASLLNYVKTYYPNIADKFDDAAIGSWLIDMVASVADNLSFHIDRVYAETNIDTANERSSIMNIARTNGLKVPGPKASVAEEKFTCSLPITSDVNNPTSTIGMPNWAYAPVIRKGTQLSCGSQFFEVMEDIDFNEQFDSNGVSNRTVIPVKNNNDVITHYRIEKTGVVYAGTTKIYKQILTSSDIKPFMEIILPDTDIMSVESIIFKDGTNYNGTPSMGEFMNQNEYVPASDSPTNVDTYRYFEVNALAEQYRWGDDISTTKVGNQNVAKPTVYTYGYYDNVDDTIIPTAAVTKGQWIPLTQKFMTEYTDNGYLKIIFGSGEGAGQRIVDYDKMENEFSKSQISKMVRNNFLGKLPQAGWTMFVQYRVGGGEASNVAAGRINAISYLNAQIGKCISSDTDASIIAMVRDSISCTNTTPSVSGKDAPSVEEIKNLIKYNNSSQERCVTLKDYISRVQTMPARYGCPFRISGIEENNKIMLYLLGVDSDGQLTNSIPTMLIRNMINYLSMYRTINDFVEMKSGRIINLSVESLIFIDKTYDSSDVMRSIINAVKSYMDINKHQMGEEIYVGDLQKEIMKLDGVINISEFRIYNETGVDNGYSPTQTAQYVIDTDDNGSNRKEIDLAASQYVLNSEPDEMFEIKYPDKDIRIQVIQR